MDRVRENTMKLDDLWVPPLMETPISATNFLKFFSPQCPMYLPRNSLSCSIRVGHPANVGHVTANDNGYSSRENAICELSGD